MKKIMALTLALIMALSLAACGGSAESTNTDTAPASGETQTEGENETSSEASEDDQDEKYVIPAESDFTFEDTEQGVVVVGYFGADQYIKIPSQLGGKDVVKIGNTAFPAGSVLGVKIPDTVTEIGERGFFYNTMLEEVEFGQNVKVVGKEAFMGCMELSKVTLNEGLLEMKEEAFSTCTALSTIDLPSTLTVLEGGAFCLSGLTAIEIPGTVSEIGQQAFGMCQQMKTAVIQDGVQKLDDEVFSVCEALESAELPASVQEFGFDVFANCPNAVIYGPAGSAAEAYAVEYEYNFEAK